jgi:hypothetical protein
VSAEDKLPTILQSVRYATLKTRIFNRYLNISLRINTFNKIKEALKNVGGDALARQIFQKKRTTARMQEVEQRRSSCRVYT